MNEFLTIFFGLLQFFGAICLSIAFFYTIVIIAKVLNITYKSLKSWMQD